MTEQQTFQNFDDLTKEISLLKEEVKLIQKEVTSLSTKLKEKTKTPLSPNDGRLKVLPKYEGPNGEKWTGRGKMPKWMSSLISQGRNKDEFFIANKAI